MKPPVDAPGQERAGCLTSSPKWPQAPRRAFRRPARRSAVAARPVSPPRRGPPDGRRAPPRRRQPALDGPQSAPRPGSGWGPTAGDTNSASRRRRLLRPRPGAVPPPGPACSPGTRLAAAFVRLSALHFWLSLLIVLGPCRGASCLLARRGRAAPAGLGPGAGTVAGARPALSVASGPALSPESRPLSNLARSSLVARPELLIAGP